MYSAKLNAEAQSSPLLKSSVMFNKLHRYCALFQPSMQSYDDMHTPMILPKWTKPRYCSKRDKEKEQAIKVIW